MFCIWTNLNGGIKGGINIADFIGDDSEGTDPKIGFNVGGYLTFDLTESITIQPELLINSVGSKYSESGTDPDLGNYSIDGSFQLTYLTFPVMFIVHLNDQINLQAGPQLGALLAAKAKFDIESDFITTSGSDDVKEQFKAIDFGLNFGLGATFGLVDASIRYSLGLAEIPEESAKVKNGVIQISLGYRIVKK